ncbi:MULTISPECIES: aspartate ammonia-lyase [Acinetobacter]|jgi:aspartate ammonia-lyase|uniref:Aspartate ammonia-lyase n=4 Tax=Acinetobacter nosocomialis TaxID=106654 RepID=A0A2T7FH03_ACINO|nr:MULTISPECIES: aspartate ammonia-lyase [Acinetobacter]MDQ9823712.1 aspartate ammonia-lyase [Acinetobacter sp. 163]AZC03632.1 aspartate ammonia-lyase [Acinetobacter nosocomialis]AZC07003.1 aspartate ammonia-lyase [Acinetobacter nosocomialis]EEW98249.2 aspartate ammonia-lyase [Acinetobacter sp. RUH 2624]EHU1209552.1 aspartate ammonia-lyase [Acinetobacter nosocomialis]
MMNADITTRIEKDLIGHREINNDHYYGVQTLRALENFNLTNSKVGNFPNLIKALAMVKLACAEANYNLKNLDQTKFEAIEYSCNQLIRGNFHDQFPIDMMQGGAGTSTNMNANEVLANVALEYMGHSKGQYQYLHPNNDINMSQSTNDVYPTAIRLGLLLSLDELNLPFNNLILSFLNKSQEFAHILKMGRTQLQDAVPMTLGQEFGAFAVTLQKDLEQINTLIPNVLAYMNLGGTAIGTGITTEYSYRELAIQALGKISGKKIKSAPDLIEATSDMGDFVLLSGLLKRTATKLSKIANDLRLLSSGPRTGINEINLEARQPGSSIMPGKVNPVIPEAMNLTCFQIIANDLAVTLAAEAGQLQLNAMEPLIAFKLFESMDLLGKAMAMFQSKCIDTITANPEHCKALVENSIGIVTALNPYLGYETTTRIAKTANETGQSVLALVQNEGLLSAQVLDDILSINNMVKPKMSA